mmetsp:Transcript_64991/g.141673  ORF Transcript_64991/g.141673 Transcript_64991/m.141673 type:complete len:203 (-) Transcript_64991:901-1509(-)
MSASLEASRARPSAARASSSCPQRSRKDSMSVWWCLASALTCVVKSSNDPLISATAASILPSFASASLSVAVMSATAAFAHSSPASLSAISASRRPARLSMLCFWSSLQASRLSASSFVNDRSSDAMDSKPAMRASMSALCVACCVSAFRAASSIHPPTRSSTWACRWALSRACSALTSSTEFLRPPRPASKPARASSSLVA